MASSSLLLELGDVCPPFVHVLIVGPEVGVLSVDNKVGHDLEGLLQVHLLERHHLFPLGHLGGNHRNPAKY